MPCDRIGAEWGAQRIKGLSVRAALVHAFRKAGSRGGGGIGQKARETSLIEHFLYPKFGPGRCGRKLPAWSEKGRRDPHRLTG